MDIKTKFNINDEVWFIHPQSHKAVLGRIKEINISILSNPINKHGEFRNLIHTGEYKEKGIVYRYVIDDNIRKEGVIKNQHEIFNSKEELIESIKLNADKL